MDPDTNFGDGQINFFADERQTATLFQWRGDSLSKITEKIQWSDNCRKVILKGTEGVEKELYQQRGRSPWYHIFLICIKSYNTSKV